MRILLIHTFYQVKGGEDNVFEQESELLGKTNEVEKLTFKNESGIKGAFQFIFTIWNVFAARKIKAKILSFKPDVIHVHNLHFAIGPIIIHLAKKMNCPIVITLHNYRLLCPSATLYNEGELFLSSLTKKFPWEAVKKKVYRNSTFQTFWLAFVIFFHKKIKTWQKVDLYIALTSFGKSLHLESDLGLSNSQVLVKPNLAFDNGIGNSIRTDRFLFVGRLTEEKGIKLLIEAIKHTGIRLDIMGDGPLKGWVEKECLENVNISYMGRKNNKEIIQSMKLCSALIFPSLWYEGMPLTIIEAFSCGTPVIASNLGAMKDMVLENNNGLHFEPSNPLSLRKVLENWASKTEKEKNGYLINARNSYLTHYYPDNNIKLLLKAYNSLNKKSF